MTKSDTFSTPYPKHQPDFAHVSAVSPVMVDGGTRFVAHLTTKFAPEKHMANILRGLRHGPIRREVILPWDGSSPLDAAPHAQVTVSGACRHILTFFVEDQVWFRWNDETRDLHVQLKAKGLWAHGYAEVMPYWLGMLAQLFTGRTDRDAISELFKCTGLELCCDFTGLQFYRSDAANFLGAKLNGDSGLPVDVWGGDGSQAVETINVGRRTANLSLCIYDKLAQIESVKNGDHSTYEATHRAHGWDGSSKIVRVEMRFAKEGMVWQEAGSPDLDLSDPWTMASHLRLELAWTIGCEKRRLIEPYTATRRERCKTDPRWDKVLELGLDKRPSAEYRQKRQVQKDTHRERVKRSRRGAILAVLRYAALHDVRLDEYSGPQLQEVVADIVASSDLNFPEYQGRYSATQLPLLSEEIRQAADLFRHRRLLRADRDRDRPRKRRAGKTGADLARESDRRTPPKV